MILFIYSIFDKVANNFGQPFYFQSDEICKRHFSNLVNQSGSIIHTNPSDFELVSLGTFNVEKGVVTGSPNPVHVAYASEFIKNEK